MNLGMLFIVLMLVGGAAAGTTVGTTTVSQTTSAVSRSYVGVVPLSLKIGFSFPTGDMFALANSGAPDRIKITASQIVFQTTCAAAPTGNGITLVANPTITTSGTTSTINMQLDAASAMIVNTEYTVTILEACLLPAPQSATFTVEAFKSDGTTRIAAVSTTSWTWTPDSTGIMTNVEVAVDPTTAGQAATTYNVKFQPSVPIPIDSFLRIVATGASPIFVATGGAGITTIVGGPALLTLAYSSSTTISNGHIIAFKVGGAAIPTTGVVTITIPAGSRVAHPSTPDTVITVNVESTDASGNAFNKQQSPVVAAQQYTLSGTMSQVSMEFLRLTKSTSSTNTNHPFSLTFKFVPGSQMLSGDWVQLRVATTGVAVTAADLAVFTTGSVMPNIVSPDGCTWTNKARPGTGTIEFTMSACTIKAGTLTSIVIPAAYLITLGTDNTVEHWAWASSYRSGSTTTLRNAAAPAAAAIIVSNAAALTATATTFARNIQGASPVSMTISYTLAATNFISALYATDYLTVTAPATAFATSIAVGATLPFTSGGGGCTLTYKGTASTTDGSKLQFTLTGTACLQAASSVNTFVLPSMYLGVVTLTEAVGVGANSAGGGTIYANKDATGVTTTTTAGTVIVLTSTALPVLFPDAPITGLRVVFSSSLVFAAGDFVTFTSTAIIVANALNVFKTTVTSASPVTVGNCIWTAESTGNTAKILKWKLSNNGEGTCLIAANEVVTFEIPGVYVENNPASGSNPRIAAEISGGATGATAVASAPTATNTAVLGYRIVGQLPPTGPSIDLMQQTNDSNRSDWVNGIVISHVQDDNATQGRIVWTKCGEGSFPQPLMPAGHPVILKMKLCGPGVHVIRRLLPDVSMQIEASYSLAVTAVVLYRTSKPTGVVASTIGGVISVGASGIVGKEKASMMLVPQTSLVTGSTSTASTGSNTTATSPSTGSSSSSSDDSAVAIGIGIGIGVGVPVLLALLGLCWYLLFGRSTGAEAANEVFYVADEKYGPQGNAYGYYGQAPGQAYGFA